MPELDSIRFTDVDNYEPGARFSSSRPNPQSYPRIDSELLNKIFYGDNKMNRLEILAQASALTGESRNKEYGEPKDNLGDCALLWDAYIQGKYFDRDGDMQAHFSITTEDVAWLNVLQKMARTFRGTPKPDTYIDAAAYAAIAGEVAQ